MKASGSIEGRKKWKWKSPEVLKVEKKWKWKSPVELKVEKSESESLRKYWR